MTFVDDEDDTSTAFPLFGGQQAVRLSDQLGPGQTRMRTQRAHDGHVQAARAERWRGDVDDMVRGEIELAGGGPHGDGLAHADLTGDDAQQRLGDAEADARHRLLVAGAFAQLMSGDGLRTWHAAEAEMGDPGHARHGCSSSCSDWLDCEARSRKAIEPKCSASCLASTSPR